jgi:zinc-binding alcohol dehydrogenase family protein
LTALFDLLQQQNIKPLVARRFPLAEARHAHELLGKGGVTGKIVLVQRVITLSQERRNNGMQRTALMKQFGEEPANLS